MSNIESSGNRLVVGVEPHCPISVNREAYPWINVEHTEISTVTVALQDGVRFCYGSIIGLNKSITRIAEKITAEDSANLQHTLFAGLPSLFAGTPFRGISRVEKAESIPATLFATVKRDTKSPSLIFAVEPPSAERELPVVLRAGVSRRLEQSHLLGLMGINPVRSRRRKAS